ncbi:hypothetical protein QQ045_005618 [Rhodiola kirilowii]
MYALETSVGLQDGRSLEAPPASSLPPNKMLKTCSIKEKGMMKKKNISWEDHEPLKLESDKTREGQQLCLAFGFT